MLNANVTVYHSYRLSLACTYQPKGSANDKLGVVTLLKIYLQGTSMSVLNFMSIQ